MRKLTTLYIFFITLFLVSCKKKYEASIPSYIAIDSVAVQTNYTEQGSASHKLSDVWVYYNDNPVGVYSLPAVIPILGDGTGKLTILPGIKNGGATVERQIYPMYNQDVHNIDLVSGDTLKIIPDFTYQSNLTFWQETFDDPSIKFSPLDLSSLSGFVVSNDPTEVFEGNGVGILQFENNETSLNVVTTQQFVLPKQDAPVYLELDYKNDIPFRAYIVAISSAYVNKYDIIEFYKKEDWNKMYLDLSFLVSNEISAEYYEIGFEAINDGNYGSDPKIYIDNLKLIHR